MTRTTLASVVALTITACGSPAPPQPPTPNRPPRIIPETVSGPTKVGTSPSCGDYTFEAAVEDPDVDDTLHYAFFIDYEKGLTQKFRDGFILPSSALQRSNKARATFSAEAGSLPLFSAGTHIVELVISDTALGTDRVQAPAGTTADGGIDPGYSDTYRWFVEAVSNGCP